MAADRRLGCLSIFLFVALCASLFVNFVLMAAVFQRYGGVREIESLPRFREILLQRGTRGADDKVVVITMRGLISSSIPGNVSDSMVDDMRTALQQAREDNRVKAIVLEIDSPGGEVTASDAIYSALVKARAKKPVVVYMESLAASGGYYVSCGGKFLMASDTTITGSIGVIIQTLNYEQLFNKVGLASVVFKSGKFKDMLSGDREPGEITAEERAMVQALIDETFEKFKSVVADGRKQAAKDNDGKGRELAPDWKSYADGRVFSGRQAHQLGFVDELGSFDTAFQRALDLGDVDDANLVQYQLPVSFGRFFRLFGKSHAPTIKLDLGVELPKITAGKMYFLSPTFLR